MRYDSHMPPADPTPPAEDRPLRRDAQRNRDLILEAAPAVFAEQGPDAPMEAIARAAGVGVATLYRRFPTRAALLSAILEQKATQLASWARDATEEPDAWQAFSGFIERAMSAPLADQVLRQLVLREAGPDEFARRLLGTLLPEVARLIERTQRAGALRADFSPGDVPPLVFAIAEVRRETDNVAPNAWRRILGFILDGLRPAAATPLPTAPLREDQLRALLSHVAENARRGSREQR